MKTIFGRQVISQLTVAAIAMCVPAVAQSQSVGANSTTVRQAPPEWAYPVNPPEFKPVPDDGSIRRVPDSSAGYTLTQTRDRFVAPDWHPADHQPMPDVVARGRKPDVFACGFCHRADGPGGPENANLAGLPAAYIVQQMADYKSGARRTAVPKRNIDNMFSISKAITDEEVEAAAAYFSALKPKSVVRVVETAIVPKTFVAGWFLAAAKPGEMEPIGQRVIEVPEDLDRFESRDTRSRFIAYVPKGSIRKGEALVTNGVAGPATQCASCHGPDLKGVGVIPPIAGRSPSYMVRQLYDMQSGARAGAAAAQMQPVVEKMTVEDMAAIAAYLTTRSP
ncbi:MAG TPA: c-type cytochrome [Burkholderiales bacterium]|nr:c-type cytochrome [Burkholderiales bacterium]